MKLRHAFHALARMVSLASLALLAVACGSDGDSNSSNGSGGSTSAASGGSGGKASGTSGGTASGGTSSSCDPTADPTGSGMACPAYVECAAAKCGTEYETCLGAGYATGDFSGASCETFMECTTGCNCDSSCSQGCFDNAGAACSDCLLNTIGNCVTTNCFSELLSCSGGGSGGTGAGGTTGTTGTTKTCADLQTCCNGLMGDEQTQCTTLYDQVKAGGDLACGTTYQIYQLSGQCS